MSVDGVRIAVVGAGRWGRNLARVFASVERCQVRAVCDVDERALDAPDLRHVPVRSTDFVSLLRDPEVTAVAIASPPEFHANQATAALEAGKHVFVEKPMALTLADAQRMREAALRSDRRLMVGHLMQYHPAITELRRLLGAGALGELRKAIAVRAGPGATSSEEGPWWALAPHDLSLFTSLFATEITELSAVHKVTASGVEVTAKVRLGTALAELFVGSGRVHKTRRLLLIGTRAAALFDDSGTQPLLSVANVRSVDHARLRDAVLAPSHEWPSSCGPVRVPMAGEEPLLIEASHFVEALLGRGPIATDADEGCSVVAALEAGNASMQARGRWVRVATSGAEPLQAMSNTA